MAWYPAAKRLPIAPGTNDPPIKVIGAILHVDAGNSASLFDYFSTKSKGIESHFHIPKLGKVQQYRDTGIEADANYKANSFIDHDGIRKGYVSIETQGFGAGEWTPHQLNEIKALLIWLSRTHGFPLQRCERSTSPGVGFHTMFGAPGPWTPVAKDCPGRDRIRQFEQTLLPWFSATAPGTDRPPIGDIELDMDERKLRSVIADELDKQDRALWTDPKSGTGKKLVIDRLARLELAVAEILKKVNEK